MNKCTECTMPPLRGKDRCLAHLRRFEPEALRALGYLCSYRKSDGELCGVICSKHTRYCRHHQNNEEVISPGETALGIEVLGLPSRAYNGLKRGGIHLVSDLTPSRLKRLRDLDRIGVKSADEIRRKVRQWNAGRVSQPSGSPPVVDRQSQPEPCPKSVAPDLSNLKGEISLFQRRMKTYHGLRVAVTILPEGDI
jgi:hypothetical protein